MSGIVGVWNRDGCAVDRSVLAAMAGTLAHRGDPDGLGLWSEAALGLACQLRRTMPESAAESQPLVDPAGTAVVFDGRLDNREELLTLLDGRLEAGVPDPAFVLAAYQKFDDGFAERLNGDFALAIYDPRGSRLLLARDAVGLRPLYYHEQGAGFFFASEVKAIAAHPAVATRPNDAMVADYLFRLFRDLEGQTFFHGVSTVLAGQLVCVTPAGCTARKYWDFDPARRVRFKSFPEYTEAFRTLFTRAVRRRLRSAGPVAVSVSGGVDSSSIFCVAETLRRGEPGRHPPVLGVSYLLPDGSAADEKDFLVAIERAYGVEIRRVAGLRRGMMHDCRRAAWHVEGPVMDVQWNLTHGFQTAVRGLGAKVLLTGHWGDQFLSDFDYVIDLWRRRAWLEAWRHIGAYGRYLEAPGLRWRFARRLAIERLPHSLRLALRALRNRVQGTRDRYHCYAPSFRARAHPAHLRRDVSARGATAHARALHREVQSQYTRLYIEWNDKVAAMHGLDVAFPFLDRDLIAFLMAIPGEVQSRNGVPKAILREALAGVLPEAIRTRSTKADFTAIANDGIAREYTQMLNLIRSSGAAVQFGYVRSDLRADPFTVSDFGPGQNNLASWVMRDLLALESWLQCFWGEGSALR